MITINDNTICYTDTIEESAKTQIEAISSNDIFKNEKIRIMPDVHAGNNCVIGFTSTYTDKLIPSIVGNDIACGMFVVELGNIDIDLEKLDKFINENIPAGYNVYGTPIADFNYSQLRCFEVLHDKHRIYNSLGTLGGGNHFIEIDVSVSGNKYLIIHSGSRNLGAQVEKIYANKAKTKKTELSDKIRRMINDYKFLGKEKEISAKIAELKENFKVNTSDFAYLEGIDLSDYLADSILCERYAKLNRELIARKILNYLNVFYINSFHVIHNYVDTEHKIIRKGAISAYKDQKVLIPLSMKSGCILGTGKGNEEWNCSAPHGAGRVMSRSQANKNITLSEFKESMQGIYTTSVTEATIDESPFVYKDATEIINNITDTVEIQEMLTPIYNFKAHWCI